MKHFIIALTIVLPTFAHALILDGVTPTSYVCRDTLVNLLGADASATKLEIKKTLDGVNEKGEVCSFELSYNERSDSKEGYFVVQAPPVSPFGHYNPAKNQKSCKADSSSVSGFHSYKSDTGWHTRNTAKVSLTKLAENGKFTLVYRQESETFTCTGELK